MMTQNTDRADDDAIWARIDRALAAIEAGVARAPVGDLAARHAALVAAHDALTARHEALRAAVVAAIARIDGLIEAQNVAGANPLNDLLAAFHPANGEPA